MNLLASDIRMPLFSRDPNVFSGYKPVVLSFMNKNSRRKILSGSNSVKRGTKETSDTYVIASVPAKSSLGELITDTNIPQPSKAHTVSTTTNKQISVTRENHYQLEMETRIGNTSRFSLGGATQFRPSNPANNKLRKQQTLKNPHLYSKLISMGPQK